MTSGMWFESRKGHWHARPCCFLSRSARRGAGCPADVMRTSVIGVTTNALPVSRTRYHHSIHDAPQLP